MSGTLIPRYRHANMIESLERRCLLSAGALDTSFSGDGRVVTSTASGDTDQGYDTVVQTDGKIVVAGANGLIRYNTNGTLDTTFGSAHTGIVTGIDARGIALQTDGKILVTRADHVENE